MLDQEVSLRSITRDNVRALCRLKARPGQLAFTVPPSISIAEATYFDEYRIHAIYLGEAPVGIVMLSIAPDRAVIERLFIDALSQRAGVGSAVVMELAERFPALFVKVVNLPGSPIVFWQKVGFALTPEIVDQHVVLKFSHSHR